MKLAQSFLSVCLLLAACSNDEVHPVSPLPDDGGPGGAGSGGKANLDASVTPTPEASAPEAGQPEASADTGVPNLPPGQYPQLLSQTGLYASVKSETLFPGVRPFQPKYTLWSDGATKRRYLYLPPGTKIDTSDMNYWKYPVGTKVWKEFSQDGTRVETRMLHKSGPDPLDWVMIAYQWKDDLSDAVAVPDGVVDARGTTHDIPATFDCEKCHTNMPDRLLGVTAIQLSHDIEGSVTLASLIADGRLTAPPTETFKIPGAPGAEQALGYLHANCGHCHNPRSSVAVTVSIDLWESVTQLDTVEDTTAYKTTVLANNSFLPDLHVIEPGRPRLSELVYRISRRGAGQMPPLATDVVDDDAVGKIRAWISTLPKEPDAGAPDAGDAGATH